MIKEKCVLVTGGAKRIGAELSKVLAQKGYNLIIHYNKSKEDAEKLRDKLREENSMSKILVYKADLTNPVELSRLIDFIEKEFCQLDILVNNASFFEKDDDKSTSIEMIDYYQAIHVTAPMFLFKWMITKNKSKNIVIVNMLDKLRSGEVDIVKDYGPYFLYSFSKHCQYLLHCYMEKEIRQKKTNCRLFGFLLHLVLSDKSTDEYFSKLNITQKDMQDQIQEICCELSKVLSDETFQSKIFNIKSK